MAGDAQALSPPLVGSDEEDIHSDERRISEERIGKAHTNEEEKMPKPKDNDAWQTGDSRIPENASDNPNS